MSEERTSGGPAFDVREREATRFVGAKANKRSFLLLVIAVSATVLLGVTFGGLLSGGSGAVYGIFGGLLLGVLSSPIVIAGLRQKDLRVAVPLLYIPLFVMTVVAVAIEFFLYLMLGMLFVSPVLVGLALPVRWPPMLEGHCASCGYDLTGLRELKCPECGTPFERNAKDSTNRPAP